MDTLPPFLRDKLHEKTSADANPLAHSLVGQALSDITSDVPLTERLAAAFDLIVASKFYQYVEPEQWLVLAGHYLWMAHWHQLSNAIPP